MFLHYCLPAVRCSVSHKLKKMDKVELKIGDKVELWNGTTGEVVGFEFPAITIQNKNSYPQEFHRINLKFVNGQLVDGRDVVFYHCT